MPRSNSKSLIQEIKADIICVTPVKLQQSIAAMLNIYESRIREAVINEDPEFVWAKKNIIMVKSLIEIANSEKEAIEIVRIIKELR